MGAGAPLPETSLAEMHEKGGGGRRHYSSVGPSAVGRVLGCLPEKRRNVDKETPPPPFHHANYQWVSPVRVHRGPLEAPQEAPDLHRQGLT